MKRKSVQNNLIAFTSMFSYLPHCGFCTVVTLPTIIYKIPPKQVIVSKVQG